MFGCGKELVRPPVNSWGAVECLISVYRLGRHVVKRVLQNVPQTIGLYCSCHAAPASKGYFNKTFYKTFFTTGRLRLYIGNVELCEDNLSKNISNSVELIFVANMYRVFESI